MFAFLVSSVILAGVLNPTFKDAAIRQCVLYSGNPKACHCALNKLSQKYEAKTFLELEAGTLPEKEQTKVLADLFETAVDCFAQDECRENVEYILGKPLAEKTCACVVQRIKKTPAMEQVSLFAINGNFLPETGKLFETKMEKEILECIPAQTTPAVRTNLIQECVAEAENISGAESLCTCVTDAVFKKYSFKEFLIQVFEETEEFANYTEQSLQKCRENLK